VIVGGQPRTTLRIDHPEPGIALVSFTTPDKLNPMSLKFVGEFSETLGQIAGDADIRVVVITGEGHGFSAGHDLGELAAAEGRSLEVWYEEQETFSNLIVRLHQLPQPLIAAVNGAAAGGGLAMALACDTRLCAESARFNAAFVRLGFSGCDVGVSYFLPRIVGPTLAFEMMLTGRLVDAAEAHAAGLVLRVVPDGEVVNAALEVARQIAGNAAFAVKMTKSVMWTNLDAPGLRAAIELENRTQVVCAGTVGQRQALSAFLAQSATRRSSR
jgi:enoyl-CoA hydratase